MRTSPPGRRLLAGVFALSLMLVFAAPALAHHAADHEQGQGQEQQGNSNSPNFQVADLTASDNDGDADSNSNTEFTEDNDTNDGGTANNVVDNNDNAHPSGKDRSVENGKSDSNPNQGKAESNPDDSKGPQRFEGGRGDDKPNGPGGSDLADQDGNNGCGNDDDFDDDNNGWCGKKPQPTPSQPPSNLCPSGTDRAGMAPLSNGSCNNPPVVFDNPPNPPGPSPSPSTQELCPAGTDNAGEPMTDPADCNDDEVEGTQQFCPEGTYKGMPFMDPEDCDEVLGNRITRSSPDEEVEGAILPFTGASSLVSFLGLALTLLTSGSLIVLKLRKE